MSGSGKTLVALSGAADRRWRRAGRGSMMAPTEILARQHHEGPCGLWPRPPGCVLETPHRARQGGASGWRKARAHLARGRDTGFWSAPMRSFRKTWSALAICGWRSIDEQHRFGVAQRMELGAKGGAVRCAGDDGDADPAVAGAWPHYGDMDVSVLDEKPPGRKPIRTALMISGRPDRGGRGRGCARALDEGRQAYWVCPLVEDSEVTGL